MKEYRVEIEQGTGKGFVVVKARNQAHAEYRGIKAMKKMASPEDGEVRVVSVVEIEE